MKACFLPVLLMVLIAVAALAFDVKAQNYSNRTNPAPAQQPSQYKVWTNPEVQPAPRRNPGLQPPAANSVGPTSDSAPAAANPVGTPRETPRSEVSLKPAQNENAPVFGPTLTKEEKAQKAVADLVASEIEIVGEKTDEKPSEKSGEKNFWDVASWVSPEGIQGSALTVLIISAVSLAPAFLMMTTSFVRIFVVLGILRHGFGTQGIPGTQVLAALALFMTFFIMYPTWEKTWNDALVPYQAGELTSSEALEKGLKPMRDFMAGQLERAGNTEEILLFWRYSSTPPDETRLAQYTADDVPLHVLLPAFMLGELKTAFLIGVQLLIPMLVIDLLVSSILVSMGMIMLPPTMVSLPFKLLLFVLADGWRLVVEMLIGSF